MKCLFFSGRVAAAVLVIALTLLVALVPAHAEISATSDALFIRSAMQPVIDFLDSPDYAKMVSWEEHVVLAYRLAADRDPSLLEFFLMRKAHEHLGLSRSDVLSIALRGKEERPSWEQCLRFLRRVSISDFQLDRGISEKVRELTAVPDREVVDTITRTTATVRTDTRNQEQVPSATGPPYEQYNTYFGYLHAHSTISDGEGSPLTAYRYARDEGGLDFFALTDHGYAFNVWPWEDEWGEVRDAAADTYEPGKYVTLWGFEWSSPIYGHINVLNSSRFTDFVSEPSLDGIYDWIEDHSGSFGRFNHPGDYDDTGEEFNHLKLYSRVVEQMVGIETWNGNDGFDRYYYAGSWSSSEVSYWDIGNQNGWYLGALGGQDNHKRDWGTRNDFRTAVLAKTLTREAVIGAYLKRRFYATEDKDLHLDFRCAGYPMGSRLDGVAPLFEVMAWDGSGDTFREVRLYRNGALLRTYDVSGNSIDIQLDGSSSNNDPAYYYVIVQENDDNDANGRNDEAISSPIWINPSPVAGGMVLLSPNGGDVVPSGSTYKVQWSAPDIATDFKLKYSLDNGATWLSAHPDIPYVTGTNYDWAVPTPLQNQKQCLMKVVGFDSQGNKLGSDKSDSTFTIEVVKLTYPDSLKTFTSGDPVAITWTTHATKYPVTKVRLFYTKDGGVTWKEIDPTVPKADTGSYPWTVPTVTTTKTKCKVKIVLKGAGGVTLGSDVSDSPFTIQPAP